MYQHEVGRAAGDKVSTTDEQDTTYGPWLVVTRRRHDNRPTKKVGPTKDTVRDPMDRGSGETNTNASPPKSFIENKLDGMCISKRKMSLGQDVMGLDRNGVTVLMPIGPMEQAGVARSGYGPGHLRLQHPAPNRNSYPSVKSKKDQARARALFHQSGSAIETNTVQFSFVPKLPAVSYPSSNGIQNPDGLFLFSSSSPTIVGDH
ncbi:hypothetical protein CMV_015323 [Castanea mollissima]|uniref:Uncharacterized protein n=1 Tax=Castanea mollissima TaxID=60419 RepID=A0A8J4QV43_9ROSI|nr:hypothetical protein CMV_015323 [Castanea mollissima]